MVRTPRFRTIVGALVGALVMTAVGTASAAQLGNVNSSGGTVEVTGEAAGNNVAATWEITPSATQVVVQVAGGHTLAALAGCTGGGTSTITCTGLSAGWELTVNLSNTQTGQVVGIFGAFAVPTVLTGGAGNDDFTGGEGTDRMVGLGGADLFVGGGGSDTADYTNVADPTRTQGVSVTLDDVANDGSSPRDGTGVGGMGGDNVRSDVENVLGTEFADTLTGNGAINLLSGFGGGDTLTGNTGSDRLIGSFGNDTLYAEDGEADAEVNCNNSDGSANEQPNTVTYDTGKDNPVNCGIAAAATGLRAREYVLSNWTVVDKAGSFKVPPKLAPRKSGKKFVFTTAAAARKQFEKAGFPITIIEDPVGITGVPREYVRDLTALRNSGKSGPFVIGVAPGEGATVSGSTTDPATVTLKIYTRGVDQRGRCRYDDALVNSLKGADIGLAWIILKQLRCKRLNIAQRFGGNDPYPIVTGANIREREGQPKSLSLRVRYPNPDSLDMILLPRDPATIRSNPSFADRAGGELAFGYVKNKDQLGLRLRRAPRNNTTISILVKNTATGLPVVSDPAGTECRQLLDVRLFGPDSQLIASQVAESATGFVTFTFGARDAGEYRITATTTPASSEECSPLAILYGTQRFTAIDSTAPFATVDGRCFTASGEGAKLKWRGIDCASAAAKDIDRLSDVARDALVHRAFTPALSSGADRATASQICMGDNPGFGGDYLVRVPTAAANYCTDTELVAIMQRLGILLGSLGGAGDKPVPLGVATPTPSKTDAAAVLKVPEVPDPECFTGTSPTIDTNGPQGTVASLKDNLAVLGTSGNITTIAHSPEQVSSVIANDPLAGATGLINLDGSTLINLDGSTLINLDGSTLINLDGATLINLDGATLTGRDGASLVTPLTAGQLRSPIAALTPGRSPVGLVSDMGGA